MKHRLPFLLFCLSFTLTQPALAQGQNGEALTVEIIWQTPVDLDLFLTDPEGETIYFANRKAKSGMTMGRETSCKDITGVKPPYTETAKIPVALSGRYRVSVDFIKDCGTSTLETPFLVRLTDKNGKQELGRAGANVKYRVLEPVAWEFMVK